jgi:hypothetical protein
MFYPYGANSTSIRFSLVVLKCYPHRLLEDIRFGVPTMDFCFSLGLDTLRTTV